MHRSTAVATGFLWFLSRAPGWFIADRSYAPIVGVSIETNQADSLLRADRAFDPGKIPLTFNERAAFSPYALQWFYPCGLLPANTEVTRRSLLDKSIGEIQFQMVRYFKKEFARERGSKSQPLLVVPADAGRGENAVIFLLPGEIVDFQVDEDHPPGVVNPKAIAGYLRTALQKRVRRVECFKRVQTYFRQISPERAVPSLQELAKAYSHAYVFENILSGPRQRHIAVSYRVYADLAPVAVTWTISST